MQCKFLDPPLSILDPLPAMRGLLLEWKGNGGERREGRAERRREEKEGERGERREGRKGRKGRGKERKGREGKGKGKKGLPRFEINSGFWKGQVPKPEGTSTEAALP